MNAMFSLRKKKMAQRLDRFVRTAKGTIRNAVHHAGAFHKGVQSFRKGWEAASPHILKHGGERGAQADRAVRGGLSAYDHLASAARDVRDAVA